MSTTNPPPGAPEPDDHGGVGPPPPPEVIKRGYEEDVYDSRTVFSVPLLVILFFVLAFGTVTIIFSAIAYPPKDGSAHPRAAKSNEADLNTRMRRIDRDPDKGNGQPRLEPLRLRSGDARAISRSELPDGNPPELHPEELRPTKDAYPTLFATGADKVGIDKTLSASDDTLKVMFPSSGNKLIGSQHVPTAANAGRGGGESPVTSPELPTPPAPKPPAPAPDPKKGGK
jgi:hypothetical protein